MVTVQVDYLNIMSAIMKMSSIKRQVENRNLTISMSTSKGRFQEEMLILSKKIEENGKAFAEIAARTEEVLRNAKAEFNQSDQLAAGQFKNA